MKFDSHHIVLCALLGDLNSVGEEEMVKKEKRKKLSKHANHY